MRRLGAYLQFQEEVINFTTEENKTLKEKIIIFN